MQAPEPFDVSFWLSTDAPRQIDIGRPRQVGCWSKQSATAGGEYLYGDKSGLVPFQQPQLPVNLNDGFPQKYIKKEVEVTGTPVEHVVRGALHAGVDVSQAQVVSFRNNLNKIAGTLLASQKPEDGWFIDGCFHNGTLFLDIVKTEERTFANSDVFEYYGYKFEAVCTGPGDVVDATSEYASVLRLRIGRHYVLMAAEIDCYDPAVPGGASEMQTYLELKTHKQPMNAYQEKNVAKDKYPRWWVQVRAVIKDKDPRWWAQSFLAGVPTLVLGGRDASGILKKVSRLDVSSLPSQAAKLGHPFDAWRLMRFTEDLLTWMAHVAAGAPGCHLRFEFVPDRRLVTFVVLAGGPLPERVHHVLSSEAV